MVVRIDPWRRSNHIPQNDLLLVGRINFRQICIFALFPPLISLLGVFILAIWLHHTQLFGYNWTCGIAYLPSVSRVLNLPAERIIWNFSISLHLPLRFMMTLHYFCKFGRQKARKQPNMDSAMEAATKQPEFFTSSERYLRLIFLASGLSDHIFLFCLSAIGERESAELHVIFFCFFLASTFIHFTCHFFLEDATTTTSDCSQQQQKNGGGKRTRMLLLAFLWLLVPFIIVCFTLHELYCTKFSYELFALGEYLTIATIFAFNSVFFLEDHQNCTYFTVKISKPKSTSNYKYPCCLNSKSTSNYNYPCCLNSKSTSNYNYPCCLNSSI